MKGWTYGAEHELADWPMLTPLPEGFKRDVRDFTMVNSNGIANDPSGKVWQHGGEINTPPTDTAVAQAEILAQLVELFPMATVNYRSNLHVHIRVPGLRDDLDLLKRVQRHIHTWMPKLLPLVEPELCTRPPRRLNESEEAHSGHLRRWRRRRVSHWTLLTEGRLQGQLAAANTSAFFAAEVPRTKATDRPMWHAQPRCCVNLRQLLETDTVEFRCFPGTLAPEQVQTALDFARDYLTRALEDAPADDLVAIYYNAIRPFPRYQHELEVRYRATCWDGSLTRDEIVANIERIQRGEL